MHATEDVAMLSRPDDARGLKALTDVQLIHRLDKALACRERDIAESRPSRAGLLLRGLPLRHPSVYMLVLLAVQMRDALRGAGLAVALAPAEQLAVWADDSRARMEGLDADIAILRMLDEMERRVRRGRRDNGGLLRPLEERATRRQT
jgi:hypothetical protein